MKQIITNNLATWTTAPKGIKKLRELILELAVRGLLVPQDTNDEPASELLKKIAAEKARLVSEGKIKPPKPLAKISEEEKPFALPESWEFVRFGEITHQITDGAHHTPTYVPKGVPFLSVKDMSSGVLKFENTRFISQEQHNELTKRCNPKCGDLLLTKVGTTGIPILIETEQPFSIFVSVALIKFDNTKISGNYLSLLIKSPFLKHQSEEGTEGVGNKNLVLRKISSFVLMIPPLTEQQRIVAKVDELMQLCDRLEEKQNGSEAMHRQLVNCLLTTLTEATDAQTFQAAWSRIAANFDCLFTTEHSIEQSKQTILQLAVMGKLVPQNPNDEPASELLNKIATEKAQLLTEGKIKKPKLFPKIGEQEKPFDLPKIWEWVRLNELVNVMDAGWSPACIASASPSNDVWGVLKTTSVQIMEYLEDKNKELPQKLEPKMQYEVKVGDILITRAGPENRVGIACSVQKTRPKLMISDKIIRFNLVEIGISEQFISLCLNTGATSEYLKKVKSGMAKSQMNISQDNLNLAPIPLPPLAEQHRIVTKVDELLTLCEQLKTKLATAQTLQQQLAETLVQKAIA